MKCDVLIAGGGLGGCAAALTAASAGRSVVLTEATDWIGGQVSQQGVPPDENAWIETCGATRRYQQYRQAVRQYYRQWFPLTRQAYDDPYLNPGGGWVSPIGHLPTVSVAVLEGMLARYLASGQVKLLSEHSPISAEVDGDVVTGVTFEQKRTGEHTTVAAEFVLDATEFGDLLPMTGCEHVTGTESQSEHDEPHAPSEANPLNMQAATWCFAMDMVDGDHVISRPASYDRWRVYVPPVTPAWPGPMFSWIDTKPRSLTPRRLQLEAGDGRSGARGVPLWTYRQILDPNIFEPHGRQAFGTQAIAPGITIVNWPQIDYIEGCLYDVPDAEAHLRGAKEQALCFFYWLQTEAPRVDGGVGYPGLRLRGDVLGTADGFAKHPYVRESRRIRARFTVTENHVSAEARRDGESERFPDAVGIGAYHLDLHPSTGGDNYIDMPSLPFQIPLGSLVPERMRNLVPACKNIGTTHITNGCYRLHPVEWTIGEAAGTLADLCLTENEPPQAVYEKVELRERLQARLRQQGVPLDWPAIRAPLTMEHV